MPLPRLLHLALIAGLATAAGSALAQYKVVGPDGRVTYTDRPPADGSVRVTDIRRSAAPATDAATTALPTDLRRLAERFPVTLFTSADCAPCDKARAYLQGRGVPYTERLVANNDDIAALERTVAGRILPSMTVGGQALRGYAPDDWASYLDAAGYPRESRLPPGWEPPAPTPLVARVPARATPVPTEAPAAPPERTPAPEQPGTTIRF